MCLFGCLHFALRTPTSLTCPTPVCHSMRSIGLTLRDKHFDPSAGRAEFIPVEWRSSLTLDGGMIDLVTPHQMLGLRQMLNDSFMDIM